MFTRAIGLGTCLFIFLVCSAIADADEQPTTLEQLQAFYPSVPDRENAALVYLQAKEGFKSDQTTLQLLHRAAAMPLCRFPIDLTKGEATELPHLQPLRELARLLKLQAVNAADEGNAKLAAQLVLDATALAQSLRNEPLLLSQLPRVALWGVSIDALEQVVNRVQLDEESLLQIQEALAKADDPQAMTRAFQGELCIYMNVKTATPEERAAQRRALDDYMRKHSELSEAECRALGPSPRVDPSPEEKQKLMQEMASKISESRLPHADFMKLVPPLSARKAMAAQQSSGQNGADQPRLHGWSMAMVATVRLAARAAAAQGAMMTERYRLKHGKSPERWEDLAPEFVATPIQDPFLGDTPLVLRSTEKGCIIYSIGDNGIDDGGQSEGRPPLDLVFRIERPVAAAK